MRNQTLTVDPLMPIRHLAAVFATCLLVNLPVSAAENVPDGQPLHLLNRLAFGPSVEDLRHVEDIGADRYIDEQLYPQAIREPPELIQRLAALDTLRLDPVRTLRDLRAVATLPWRGQAFARGSQGAA